MGTLADLQYGNNQFGMKLTDPTRVASIDNPYTMSSYVPTWARQYDQYGAPSPQQSYTPGQPYKEPSSLPGIPPSVLPVNSVLPVKSATYDFGGVGNSAFRYGIPKTIGTSGPAPQGPMPGYNMPGGVPYDGRQPATPFPGEGPGSPWPSSLSALNNYQTMLSQYEQTKKKSGYGAI